MLTVIGDVWSTNAGSLNANTSVQCVSGISFTLGNPTIPIGCAIVLFLTERLILELKQAASQTLVSSTKYIKMIMFVMQTTSGFLIQVQMLT